MGHLSSFARPILVIVLHCLTEPVNAPELGEGGLLLFFQLFSFSLLMVLHTLSLHTWASSGHSGAVFVVAEPGGICCSDKGRKFGMT